MSLVLWQTVVTENIIAEVDLTSEKPRKYWLCALRLAKRCGGSVLARLKAPGGRGTGSLCFCFGFCLALFRCGYFLVVRDALRRKDNFCGERNTDEINMARVQNNQRGGERLR